MAGIFQSLEIARKALWTSQSALSVTSNNIANVNTPGYSRQRAELSSSFPIDLGFGPMGTGVIISNITRSRNILIDNNLRDSYTKSGYSSTEEALLTQLDLTLKEPGEGGLSSVMNNFFNEWSNLANNPENTSSREVLLQKGKGLTNAFNNIYQKLTGQKQQIAKETQSTVENVNHILEQISSLNQKISYSEVGGNKANDLRDKRDLMLDQLSQFGKINFEESSQGMLNVSFEGVTLVTGTNFTALKSEEVNNTQGEKVLQISIKSSSQTISLSDGKLGSLTKQYNSYIPDKLNQINELASSIITEVNKIHSASYGLAQGNPPSASKGINFFTGNSASNIKLDGNVLNNTDNIAISNTGEPGDVESALTIANLGELQLMNGRKSTFNDFYSSVVTKIGLDIQNVQEENNQQNLIISQLENQRDAVSGVNIDEEMINLTRFQRSYEAASKVIKTIDQIMETIINLK